MTTSTSAGPGAAVLAFDVGGTDMKAALLDEHGRMLESTRVPTPLAGERTGDRVVEEVSRIAEELTARHPEAHPRAAGLLVPGHVDDARGVGVFAENLGWREFPFRDRAQAALDLPVGFGHDVRGAGEAEHRMGAARGFDDVVVVNNEWGRIEEITLTYVVVHIWDDRRMVLPSTFFTMQPFENWTRQHSELLGAVEFDLDWRVSPDGMRKELDRILGKTELWDKRTSVLQVTDAIGGFVHVRVLVTAKDAPTLFDLRCYVRENLVAWIQREGTGALPRQRVELVEAGGMDASQRSRAVSGDSLFSGSIDAEQRASQFTDSIPTVTKEPPA